MCLSQAIDQKSRRRDRVFSLSLFGKAGIQQADSRLQGKGIQAHLADSVNICGQHLSGGGFLACQQLRAQRGCLAIKAGKLAGNMGGISGGKAGEDQQAAPHQPVYRAQCHLRGGQFCQSDRFACHDLFGQPGL